jgi:dihydrofolate synthase / folylpolyglutamate synthase
MRPEPLRSVEQEYEEAVSFLYSLERFGILLGLENISLLLHKLGDPQHRFRVVHVAGSNGKGSTCAFICEILTRAGLKTALYTSPHLNDFRERIRIDGAMISKEALVASTRRVRSFYDPERTTFFEFTTAVAFDCIARAEPDIAVIEVGLGGRLDATNTVRPAVTVITDISREHEDYLGVGIASVAREKAGIIKQHVPLITGAARKEARAVILDIARTSEAPVKEFGRDFRGVRSGHDTFRYQSKGLELKGLSLGMAGSHQMKNASLAVAAVEELAGRGINVPEDAIRAGIRHTRFAGRFELLRREPDVVIDGAHTPEGMKLLKSTLKRFFPGVRPLMLLGMLKDKNYETLAKIIAPLAKEVMCVPPQGDRALDPEELAELVRRLGVPADASSSITEGFSRLLEKASEEDLILATGSLYMIGPVRQACGVQDQ